MAVKSWNSWSNIPGGSVSPRPPSHTGRRYLTSSDALRKFQINFPRFSRIGQLCDFD
jgi:hypothetical protein